MDAALACAGRKLEAPGRTWAYVPKMCPKEKPLQGIACKGLKSLVRATRIELVAYCLGGSRSIQLSYGTKLRKSMVCGIFTFRILVEIFRLSANHGFTFFEQGLPVLPSFAVQTRSLSNSAPFFQKRLWRASSGVLGERDVAVPT